MCVLCSHDLTNELVLVTITLINISSVVPYSRKYWRGIWFDSLTISRPTIKLTSINMNFPNTISPGAVSFCQIKIRQMLSCGQFIKFNSCQYFRLYSNFANIWPTIIVNPIYDKNVHYCDNICNNIIIIAWEFQCTEM